MALTLLQMKAQFQDPMRQGVVDMLWQSSRVLQFVYFIENQGLSYAYARRTALPGVGFRTLNSTFNPTAGVINPAVEQLAILGGKIQTDSIALALKGPRARTNEIAGMIEAAGKFFDKNFFVGDPSVAATAGQNANANIGAFYGLRKRLAGTQLITPFTNGGVVTTDAINLLLDAVEGDNGSKVLFMNRTNRRNLSAAKVGAAKGSQVVDVGLQLAEYNGAKIVEVFKDEAEQEIMPFNEVCGTSGAACSSIYCVKFGQGIDERGVQGITGLPEKIQAAGPFNFGEYLQDVVQMVAGIGVFGGYVAARLQGIKAQ